jgi:hypothetical protein
MYNPEKESVAAVIGSEMRVYGPVSENGKRPLERVREFAHHGAAKMAAQDFDDFAKESANRRGR